MPLFDQLTTSLPTLKFSQEVLLAKYTQVKIGGPAEVFAEVKNQAHLIKLLQYCHQRQLRYYLLGWGANTLIADRGLRGLVIKNAATEITIQPDQELDQLQNNRQPPKLIPRWEIDDQHPTAALMAKVEQKAAHAERCLVKISAGTPLPVAINQLCSQGIGGLEWFAKIPATIGGAIYNNIHGGKHFLSEVLYSVEILNQAGEIEAVPITKLDMDYDLSRFHTSNEVILAANFLLYKLEPQLLQQVALNWAKSKANQPQKSLGCVFQNLHPTDQERLQLPTSSVGYFIDKVLNLKGFQIGDAIISPLHAAFIVNLGHATAADYLAVIRHVQQAALQQSQLFLKPEIFFLGFTKQELRGIVAPV